MSEITTSTLTINRNADKQSEQARYIFTILGCGSSGGVPRIGDNWGCCDPNNPKNRRQRCSLLVEKVISNDQKTTVLIDSGPDIRNQLLANKIDKIDAVVYTHAHADHVHGIDELRVVALNNGGKIPVYMDENTSSRLHQAFGYCFVKPENSNYPPIMIENIIKPDKEFEVGGQAGAIKILPIRQIHGEIDSLGFKIANVAYSCDLNDIPRASIKSLTGLDVWIVDCLQEKFHTSHFNLEATLSWIDKLKPKHAILTDMHINMDYDQLAAKLPANVEPGYDQLRFTIINKD